MKLSGISTVKEVMGGAMRRKDVIEIVDQIFDRFVDDPCKVSPKVYLYDTDEEAKKWPSKQDLSSLDRVKQIAIINKIRYSIKPIKEEIEDRVRENRSKNFLWRWELRHLYLGNGEVALYWDSRKKKKHASKDS